MSIQEVGPHNSAQTEFNQAFVCTSEQNENLYEQLTRKHGVSYGNSLNVNYVCGYSSNQNNQEDIAEEEYHLATYEDPHLMKISQKPDLSHYDEEPMDFRDHRSSAEDFEENARPSPRDDEHYVIERSEIAFSSHADNSTFNSNNHENSVIPTYCDVNTTTNNDTKINKVNNQAIGSIRGKLITDNKVAHQQYRT